MTNERAASDASFLFYDYETFGTDPARDRISQFGAVRTDDALNPIGDPVTLYCQPAMDTLPHPEACLLTGITPQRAQTAGLCEWEFAAQIHELMAQAQTCTLGYNSFRFDDEFTRYLFYRNAIDPYAREYKNGNSRYDLIDLVRLCYALRPAGIQWPMHEDGRPSFRLEDLSRANHIEHGQAHDATADVYATIAIARLLRKHQPRLWQWALSLRDRYQVEELLHARQPLIHASARFAARHGGVALVLPLGDHPRIRNQHVVFDLSHSPAQFLQLPLNELKDYLYTPSADLPEGMQRIPVKTIKTNRAPVLAPMATLRGVDTQRIQLDLDAALKHAEELQQCEDMDQRLQALFASDPWPAANDPEAALYEGFIENHDRRVLNDFHYRPVRDWAELEKQLSDPRLPEIMFRTRARNFPDTLSVEEEQRWEAHRYQRLLKNDGGASIQVPEYRQRLEQLRISGANPAILDALEAWLWELRIGALEQSHGEH